MNKKTKRKEPRTITPRHSLAQNANDLRLKKLTKKTIIATRLVVEG